MRTKDLQGYGHTGLEVRLNLMDQVAITDLVDSISEHIENIEDREKNNVPYMGNIIPDIKLALVFLRKLALANRDKASVFEEETKDIEVEA